MIVEVCVASVALVVVVGTVCGTRLAAKIDDGMGDVSDADALRVFEKAVRTNERDELRALVMARPRVFSDEVRRRVIEYLSGKAVTMPSRKK